MQIIQKTFQGNCKTSKLDTIILLAIHKGSILAAFVFEYSLYYLMKLV